MGYESNNNSSHAGLSRPIAAWHVSSHNSICLLQELLIFISDFRAASFRWIFLFHCYPARWFILRIMLLIIQWFFVLACNYVHNSTVSCFGIKEFDVLLNRKSTNYTDTLPPAIGDITGERLNKQRKSCSHFPVYIHFLLWN